MRKLKICMLCDRLSLGGVETHVITLANRLAGEGHHITLISGGGALTDLLEGVKHISLPLYRKRSYFSLLFRLWRFFRRERFDIVHTHTRFSAFLCRPLIRDRLVSTAHWVFDTRFPKGTLTTWGDATLAVSPDIADYLEKNYGMKKKEITVTVNGINTDRFYPAKTRGEAKKVVYCSRLDHDRATVAFLLLEILPRLTAANFSLTVLGAGDRLEEFKFKSEELLRKHPTLSLHVLGGVSNVEEHVRDADIVIGVSRAALEGMAAGAAVLLAGNEGYLSVFDPRAAKIAEETNFCCRGAEKATAVQLYRDLSHLLSLPKERLHRMGEANRRYVITHYSEGRMTKDALAVYERICKRRAVLCGYYGFSNIGDELLLRAMQKKLWEAGYQRIDVLSAKKLSFRAFISLRHGYDLILGGGNLLQDATSRRSLRFYLFCAAQARGHIEIHGGIGPLSHAGERSVTPLLERASTVFCRTEGDLRQACRLGAKHPRISCDAALMLPFPKKKKGEKILLAFKSPSDTDRAALLAFLLSLCRNFGKERFLLFVMHPDDLAFAKYASRLSGIPVKRGDADVFLSHLSCASLVFASRLHAGIAALGMGIPFYLWEGEEKCRFLIEDIQRLPSGGAFCALFSYNDRPTAWLPSAGIQKAKALLCQRMTENEQAFF